MSRMTWGEFKQFMESQGVKDDMPIRYFDFSYPNNSSHFDELHVVLPTGNNEGLVVTN